ncbi:outer membrane protein assembly factor BamB [Nitrogeniibacter mangrovi]|uniref:Outer membrane protein assembly factor BamB n=1 Tax=Nitrogeniibacter mangrovi TaxID=2016596 RepID=A0A6C1B8B5_9RHOO|nr:outer membrane protein assembly factor BamB [Nitrogeniibacter mangrovi]QID18580.1 outer membrane protein assembly factor BamB [Nitrogeniibacter mangrovi]
MKQSTRFLRALPLVAALTLTACSSLNPFSSSGPKMTPLTDIQASVTLIPRWSASVGDAGIYRFSPAVVDGEVVAAGAGGEVVRLGDGGQVRWRTDLKGGLTAGVGADPSLAVVANAKGEVIALDGNDGAERWRAAINAEVLAAPAVGRDVVVVRTSDNRLFALDKTSGEVKWTYKRNTPPLTLRSQPGMLIDQNVAVTGFPGGKIAALNLTNGGLIWELTVAYPEGTTEIERIADVTGVPVLYRQNLCAATFQGRVSCFDITNGKTIWSRPISTSVGIDRDARQVYVSEAAGAVSALDAFNGASMWRQGQLGLRQLSAPLVTEAGIVVGDAEGYLHVLDHSTGAFIGRVKTDGSPILTAPQALHDGVLVQTRDGRVSLFDLH